MIKITGETNGSHDPKLKAPLVGSPDARAAAERAMSTGDAAELRKGLAAAVARISEITARIAALEAKSVPHGVTESVTALDSKPTPAKSNKRRQSNATPRSNSLTDDVAFDKKAYQRDLIRKRRAAAKQKAKP